jgi:hypothetical protein
VNFIDHAVGSDAEAPSWATGELFATGWTRVHGEISYGFDNARLVNSVDLGQLLLSNSQDIDRVTHTV